mmetsp:Transcript_12005/g.17380  ORF Transcript_12005/g.17380 Transcript_12005/m.17380 type:complete len:188 (-) Transcript_12005:342-905(-)|eukprot:CAMPEP_0195526242 /NCGR_PEP_ID=MMETSP0794_2-20130614/27184_1 /TAXON_ID=515487 /ORGANISM="Stephanopyxis turris, Strain CCMP 815" /LENGTH=187 /DNA_ID=CAMNT_0040656875 /DNA_START=112 /DNA_END=675 /DNA_ORIENTATION=-
MFEIREFKESDIKELVQHDRQMTRELLGDKATPYDEDWLRDITAPRRKKYRSYHTLVVVADNRNEDTKNNIHGQTIGFAILHLRKRAIPMPKVGSRKRIRKHFVEIFFLSVAAEYRSQGIGGHLIDAAENWAISQNAIELRLAVMDTNVDANRFYARNGFEDIGLMLDYPEVGLVSHRMRRRICEPK